MSLTDLFLNLAAILGILIILAVFAAIVVFTWINVAEFIEEYKKIKDKEHDEHL